jgi:hypothetical protein
VVRLRGLALVLLAVVAVNACDAFAAEWTGPGEGIHQVGGYWVGVESTCLATDAVGCGLAVQTALGLIPEADRTAVTETSVAGVPPGEIYAGFSFPEYVILTLSSGDRRVVPLFCGNSTASPNDPYCNEPPAGSFDEYRVGPPLSRQP